MIKEPTVLLIEDNEGDIELIKEAFVNTEIRKSLKICTNGEQAIDYIKDSNRQGQKYLPSIILLDINLPKIDGKEVLIFLKNDQKLKKIPVIILSSSALPKDIAFAYENHANSYIVKPSTLMDFTKAIRCIEMYWIDCVTYPKAT